MKKFGLLFFVVLSLTFSSQLSAQNVSPHFSELKGMEDAQGNTHLLYRIYSYQILQPFGFYEDNSLYHFDLGNQKDTLFIRESGSNISAHIYIERPCTIRLNRSRATKFVATTVSAACRDTLAACRLRCSFC